MQLNLSTLGHRVRFARLNAGFVSQEALAKQIGISQQSLARIEADLVKRPRALADIAMATGFSAHWLISGKGNSLDVSTQTLPERAFILELCDIPLYLDPVKAKDFKPNQYLTLPLTLAADHILVKVDGDSMVSLYNNDCSFKDGTLLVVDIAREAKNGNYVIAQYDHVQPPIFKKYREDAGRKYLLPLSPHYESIRVDNNPFYKILGVVVAHLTIDL